MIPLEGKVTVKPDALADWRTWMDARKPLIVYYRFGETTFRAECLVVSLDGDQATLRATNVFMESR